MKKFVEPELRRIELKLTENIAASDYSGTFNNQFYTHQDVVDCNKIYEYTGISTSKPYLSLEEHIKIYDCAIYKEPMSVYLSRNGL